MHAATLTSSEHRPVEHLERFRVHRLEPHLPALDDEQAEGVLRGEPAHGRDQGVSSWA